MRPIPTLALAGACLALPAAAGGWTTGATLQGTHGRYGGSQEREGLRTAGVLIAADYLERGGISLGYMRGVVGMRTGLPDIHQDAVFASARSHLTPDALPGRLSLRLDLHALDNDDATGVSDDVRVLAPQVAYLAFDQRRYLDLGFARSRYPSDLTVDQWTPTLGLALGDGAHWLQLRGWFIDPSAPVQGKDSTAALEAKWTWWPAPGGAARPERVSLGFIAGTRLYAVDIDAGHVANLADPQRGGVNLGAEWALGGSWRLTAQAGSDRYRNATLADDYRLDYLWLGLSARW